jgi:predicted enzyme related to lactoylglutathione lyase
VGEPGGHSVVVAPPGDRFILHLCEGFGPVEPGNSGIAFMTDDIDGLVRKMTSASVTFAEPLKKEAWGAMAKFADPDGNVFWLLGAPASFIRQETSRKG